MILLVVDTSGKNGSVGLARVNSKSGPPNSVEPDLIETVPLVGGTFSAQLIPQISSLLAKHQLDKKKIDAFVVVAGPGSFTGLRVGLAVIKALAEIFQKPIVPVSLLEVVAMASRAKSKVLAALDAGRGEIYAGEYEFASVEAQPVPEHLLNKDEFLSAARSQLVATSDESVARIVQESGQESDIAVTLVHIGAEEIARLGWRRIRAGAVVSPEQLEANYIRRTDAEIFAKTSS
jgi:tRNA threonylcarbamoyladenosine biosynthesis protein TsaB